MDDFWRKYLGDYVPGELPGDFPRSSPSEAELGTVPFSLPRHAFRAVAGFSSEHRVPRSSVLVSAFALAIADRFGLDQVVVGIPVVPLRFDLRAGPGTAEVCLATARSLTAVAEHYETAPALPGLSFSGLGSGVPGAAGNDIHCDVDDAGAAIGCVLRYRAELFRRVTLEGVATLLVGRLHDLLSPEVGGQRSVGSS